MGSNPTFIEFFFAHFLNFFFTCFWMNIFKTNNYGRAQTLLIVDTRNTLNNYFLFQFSKSTFIIFASIAWQSSFYLHVKTLKFYSIKLFTMLETELKVLWPTCKRKNFVSQSVIKNNKKHNKNHIKKLRGFVKWMTLKEDAEILMLFEFEFHWDHSWEWK